jgi:thioredoxin-related protein
MKLFAMIVASVLAAGTLWAGEVKWEKNYADGLAQAKKEKKLVMVDVYTDWCHWCKKLDKDTYANKEVAEKLAKEFISIKLNPEKSTKNRKVAEEFGVRGYPNIIFLDSDGKKLAQLSGYRPADAFLKQLEALTQKK